MGKSTFYPLGLRGCTSAIDCTDITKLCTIKTAIPSITFTVFLAAKLN